MPDSFELDQPNEGAIELRDFFAAHALSALVGHPAIKQRGAQWLAEHAYIIADAMIVARRKTDLKEELRQKHLRETEAP